MQQWYMQCVFADGAHRGSVSATAFNLEVLQMKYVGRLVVLAQAALMASWVSAGTVTLNNLSCGSTTSDVVIDASGNITLSTNDTTSCAPGSSGGTGPYALNVTVAGTGTKGTVTSSPAGIDCAARLHRVIRRFHSSDADPYRCAGYRHLCLGWRVFG